MKPKECRLETRAGNWVIVFPHGECRPATSTEVFLWMQLVDLKKASEAVFDIKGEKG